MAGIRILPEILSNQIAAGEVVERPASVIKELVENCLDAHATSILIETTNGGKSLIRVSDNGDGMSRDDALLSIERYATSKIYTTEDLFSISTMGFRGEALPSIASVSKLTLVTRTADSDVATKIEMAGGKLINVSDAGAPVGTLVEVRQLFFNTPARRKFLKSENTESSHIADTVLGIALGNPMIQFRLFSGNQLQKNFSGNEDAFARAHNVLGRSVQNALFPIEYSDGISSVTGFVSSPMVTRSTASKVYLFVNKRLVRDRGLMFAVFRGYAGRIMKQRFPHAVISVDLPPDQVDVNVHPAKREVRFADSEKVYQAVSLAISSALMTAEKKASGYSQPHVPQKKPPSPDSETESLRFEFGQPATTSKGREPELPFSRSAVPDTVEIKDSFGHAMTLVEESATPWEDGIRKDTRAEPPGSSPSPGGKVIIGQVMGTYIVAESSNGMVLIDQHAAHERIVFERLKKRFETLSTTSQDLVVPETLELGFKEANLMTGMLDDFAAIGIRIEPFGGTTFIIKSIPGIIDGKDVASLVSEIIETSLENKNRLSKEQWLDECLIMMACHDAIRANYRLNQKQMEQLVIELENCENSMHCPHGRPTVLHFDKAKMEKLFKRVV